MDRFRGGRLGLVVAATVLMWAVPRAAAPRSYLSSVEDNFRMQRVVERASLRLAKAECQRLFTDHTDGSGQPLQAKLDALGLSGQSYLTHVVFRDGSSHRTCSNGRVAAFTSPGSRVVSVCNEAFFQAVASDHFQAEAIVIHEALHTLGLGENPPTSREITASVVRRCQ